MTGTQRPCPTAKELADFANGRVSSVRLSELAEHLESCQACVEQLAQGTTDDPLVERLENIEYVEGQKGPRTSEDPFELDENFRYQLIAELGEGGMGQVFKARHRVMKRIVALKTIRPELINHPEAVKRFAQEARAAARLSHPNIVTAFDAEQCGDLHMLVMEFVDGESISMMVNRWGPLPAEKAVDYTCQAADGLQHAHERKMIHRDVKPQNLMLTGDGIVKILDFGLSKFRKDLEAGETDSVTDETLLTLRNISLGTEGFIAPEQAEDASSVDIRSDIYSLGCTLFFMLTNRPPYFGAPPSEPSAMPDVTRFRSDLPDGLAEILEKMMASEPSGRFTTPGEVAQALRMMGQASPPTPAETQPTVPTAAALPEPAKAKPFSPGISWAVSIGILLAVGLMIWFFLANSG